MTDDLAVARITTQLGESVIAVGLGGGLMLHVEDLQGRGGWVVLSPAEVGELIDGLSVYRDQQAPGRGRVTT